MNDFQYCEFCKQVRDVVFVYHCQLLLKQSGTMRSLSSIKFKCVVCSVCDQLMEVSEATVREANRMVAETRVTKNV